MQPVASLYAPCAWGYSVLMCVAQVATAGVCELELFSFDYCLALNAAPRNKIFVLVNYYELT